MLSISFSKIVANIKRGGATIPDRQAIHLWSTICLHHLQYVMSSPLPVVPMTDLASPPKLGCHHGPAVGTTGPLHQPV